MTTTPKSSRPWVKALLHSVYDQPDTDAVNDHFDRIVDAPASNLPAVADTPRDRTARHPGLHQLLQGDLEGEAPIPKIAKP